VSATFIVMVGITSSALCRTFKGRRLESWHMVAISDEINFEIRSSGTSFTLQNSAPVRCLLTHLVGG